METTENRIMERVAQALNRVAEQEHIDYENVRHSIICAIEDMMVNGTPEQKGLLAAIPCEGNLPTPEEFIAYTIKMEEKNKN